MDYKNYEKLKDILTYKIFDNIYGMRKEKISFNYKDIIFVIGLALLSLERKNIEEEKILNKIKIKINHKNTNDLLKELITSYSKEIEEISQKYDEDELKATILFSESRLFSKSSENRTVRGVAQVVIDLLEIEKEDTVLDLGSGVNSFLTMVGYQLEPKKLIGIEKSNTNIIIGEIRKYITEIDIEIIEDNMLEKSKIKGDKVFIDSPLGVKLAELYEDTRKNLELREFLGELKINSTGEWIYGINGYLKTKSGGKTIIVMTNAGTWNKSDEDIRKKLVEKGLVEGVIALTSNLLSYTNIPITLVILSQNNTEVRMVDATEFYTKERRQHKLEKEDIKEILQSYRNDTKTSKKIKNEYIANNDYILNPMRYIVGDNIKNPITIGEISKSISRGGSIKSSELDELITTEETDCSYVMLKNIQGGIIENNLQNLKYIDEKYKKYCLKNKSLLISKNAPFKISTIEVAENKKILTSNNLYFLEIDEEKIDPDYVAIYLNSEEGLNQLNRLAKGTIISNIGINDVKKIKIPQISEEEQKIIVNHYKKINNSIINKTKRIEELEKYKKLVIKRSLEKNKERDNK